MRQVYFFWLKIFILFLLFILFWGLFVCLFVVVFGGLVCVCVSVCVSVCVCVCLLFVCFSANGFSKHRVQLRMPLNDFTKYFKNRGLVNQVRKGGYQRDGMDCFSWTAYTYSY